MLRRKKKSLPASPNSAMAVAYIYKIIKCKGCRSQIDIEYRGSQIDIEYRGPALNVRIAGVVRNPGQVRSPKCGESHEYVESDVFHSERSLSRQAPESDLIPMRLYTSLLIVAAIVGWAFILTPPLYRFLTRIRSRMKTRSHQNADPSTARTQKLEGSPLSTVHASN